MSERNHYAERQAGFVRHADSQKREIEQLKTRVEELEQWEPHDPRSGRVKVPRRSRS